MIKLFERNAAKVERNLREEIISKEFFDLVKSLTPEGFTARPCPRYNEPYEFVLIKTGTNKHYRVCSDVGETVTNEETLKSIIESMCEGI